MTTQPLRVNSARLNQSLMTLAQLGATAKGGVCRLALTDLDRQARDLVVGWAKAEGCTIRIDQIGNIFMRRAGSDPTRAAVATGSHIDTQPTGGKFDGNYGVLAGIEVIRRLNELNIETVAPIEVCIWTNEEGSRFVPVMMGSGVYAGAFTLDHARAARDRDGISVSAALTAIGYNGATPASVAEGAPRLGAYFEAHIEQGPVLEAAERPLGAVTGALGQRWYDITITGMEAHAGPTPMSLRKDAMQAAAQLVTATRSIALDYQPHGRGTVGSMDVFPNSRNVIPGGVRFTVDFRHADDATLLAMDAALRARAAAVASDFNCNIDIQQVVYFAPTHFDAGLVQSIRDASQALGFEAMDIVSGAGHDAVYAARTCPAAMIFIPCKDGISHNEIEDAREEDLGLGADVLFGAMIARAGAGAS
ncbi:MAG: Zn-dependent hydrolase [Betaproteobacteria bacterium]|nr:MAG: Zn-dependent hydrolase [Betaproteobacteria bacterium]